MSRRTILGGMIGTFLYHLVPGSVRKAAAQTPGAAGVAPTEVPEGDRYFATVYVPQLGGINIGAVTQVFVWDFGLDYIVRTGQPMRLPDNFPVEVRADGSVRLHEDGYVAVDPRGVQLGSRMKIWNADLGYFGDFEPFNFSDAEVAALAAALGATEGARGEIGRVLLAEAGVTAGQLAQLDAAAARALLVPALNRALLRQDAWDLAYDRLREGIDADPGAGGRLSFDQPLTDLNAPSGSYSVSRKTLGLFTQTSRARERYRGRDGKYHYRNVTRTSPKAKADFTALERRGLVKAFLQAVYSAELAGTRALWVLAVDSGGAIKNDRMRIGGRFVNRLDFAIAFEVASQSRNWGPYQLPHVTRVLEVVPPAVPEAFDRPPLWHIVKNFFEAQGHVVVPAEGHPSGAAALRAVAASSWAGARVHIVTGRHRTGHRARKAGIRTVSYDFTDEDFTPEVLAHALGVLAAAASPESRVHARIVEELAERSLTPALLASMPYERAVANLTRALNRMLQLDDIHTLVDPASPNLETRTKDAVRAFARSASARRRSSISREEFQTVNRAILQDIYLPAGHRPEALSGRTDIFVMEASAAALTAADVNGRLSVLTTFKLPPRWSATWWTAGFFGTAAALAGLHLAGPFGLLGFFLATPFVLGHFYHYALARSALGGDVPLKELQRRADSDPRLKAFLNVETIHVHPTVHPGNGALVWNEPATRTLHMSKAFAAALRGNWLLRALTRVYLRHEAQELRRPGEARAILAEFRSSNPLEWMLALGSVPVLFAELFARAADLLQAARRPGVKAFVLDLGNVLVELDFRRMRTELAKHTDLGPDEFWAKIAPAVRDYQVGALSEAAFYGRLRSEGFRGTEREFRDAFNAIFGRPVPGMAEFVRQAKKSGYKIVFLSDNNPTHLAALKERFADVFASADAVLVSHEEGRSKPDPELYRRALAAAGVSAAEAVFVDDRAGNARGALRQSIWSFEFRGFAELWAGLRNAAGARADRRLGRFVRRAERDIPEGVRGHVPARVFPGSIALLTDALVAGVNTVAFPKPRRAVVFEASPGEADLAAGLFLARLSEIAEVVRVPIGDAKAVERALRRHKPELVIAPHGVERVRDSVAGSARRHRRTVSLLLYEAGPKDGLVTWPYSEQDHRAVLESVLEHRSQLRRTPYDGLTDDMAKAVALRAGMAGGTAQAFRPASIEGGAERSGDKGLSEEDLPLSAEIPLLVLSPHPDDLEIAAGGLARKHMRAVPEGRTAVLNWVATGGANGVPDDDPDLLRLAAEALGGASAGTDAGGLRGRLGEERWRALKRRVRAEEQRDATAKLSRGVPGRVESAMLGLEELAPGAVEDELWRRLTALYERHRGSFRKGEPFTVVLPDPEDAHPTHRWTTDQFRRALVRFSKERRVSVRLLYYRSPWAGSDNVLFVSDPRAADKPGKARRIAELEKRALGHVAGELTAGFGKRAATSEELGGLYAERFTLDNVDPDGRWDLDTEPRVTVHKDFEEMSRAAARRIADRIRAKPDLVLGLATGSTPLGVYEELIRLHRAEGLDLSKVRIFHLDEYVGLPGTHEQSYQFYLWENFLKHVNVQRENINYLNGLAADPAAEAERYEAAIRAAGGIDIQILGIGSNGHIAFNEPGSAGASRTREVELAGSTIRDNARFFVREVAEGTGVKADEDALVAALHDGPALASLLGGEEAARDFRERVMERVPKKALSQGIGTILEAKEVILLANKAGKAEAVRDSVRGFVSVRTPASFLQRHPRVWFDLDPPAASLLEPEMSPIEAWKDRVRRWRIRRKLEQVRFNLAIRLGGTNATVGFATEEGRIEAPRTVNWRDVLGPAPTRDEFLALLGRLIADQLRDCGVPFVREVGIAWPGPGQHEDGLAWGQNMPGFRWDELSADERSRGGAPVAALVRAEIRRRTGRSPVIRLLGDAGAAALSEYGPFGTLPAEGSGLGVIVGTGVGMGVVHDHKLFDGGPALGHSIGSLGHHAVLNESGDGYDYYAYRTAGKIEFDRRGRLLEHRVAGPYLAVRFAERVRSLGPDAGITFSEDLDGLLERAKQREDAAARVILDALNEAHAAGNKTAREFVAEAGRELGLGLGAFMARHRGEDFIRHVVLMGGVAENLARPGRQAAAAAPSFTDALKATVRGNVDRKGRLDAGGHHFGPWLRDTAYASLGLTAAGEFGLVREQLKLFLPLVKADGQVPLKIGQRVSPHYFVLGRNSRAARAIDRLLALFGIENADRPVYDVPARPFETSTPALDGNALLLIMAGNLLRHDPSPQTGALLGRHYAELKRAFLWNFGRARRGADAVSALLSRAAAGERVGAEEVGRLGPDELLIHSSRPSVGTWQDNTYRRGHILEPNVLLFQAVREFSALASAAGDAASARVADLLAARFREVMIGTFFDEDAGHFREWTDADGSSGAFDTAANMLAVYFGLADPARAASVFAAVERLGVDAKGLILSRQPFEEQPMRALFAMYKPLIRRGLARWPWNEAIYLAALSRHAAELAPSRPADAAALEQKVAARMGALQDVYVRNGFAPELTDPDGRLRGFEMLGVRWFAAERRFTWAAGFGWLAWREFGNLRKALSGEAGPAPAPEPDAGGDALLSAIRRGAAEALVKAGVAGPEAAALAAGIRRSAMTFEREMLVFAPAPRVRRVSEEATAASDRFMETRAQYALGRLTTERLGDLDVSGTVREPDGVRRALEMLASEEASVGGALNEAIRKGLLKPVVKAMTEALARNGRIVFVGAGSMLRQSTFLEREWRNFLAALPPELRKRLPKDAAEMVIGTGPGGDLAQIRAVENMEDNGVAGAAHMRRLVKDLRKRGVTGPVVVVGHTASGMSSYVLEALKAAASLGASPVFVTNNPIKEISSARRAYEAVADPRIMKLPLLTGPPPIAGSTRLQPTTAGMAALGAALSEAAEGAFPELRGSPERLSRLRELAGRASEWPSLLRASLSDLARFVELKASVYAENPAFSRRAYGERGYATFLAGKRALHSVLSNDVEEAPTFGTPPYRSWTEIQGGAELSPSGTLAEAGSPRRALEDVFGRPPRGLDLKELLTPEQLDAVYGTGGAVPDLSVERLLDHRLDAQAVAESRPMGSGNLVAVVLLGEDVREFMDPASPLRRRLEEAKKQGAKTAIIAVTEGTLDRSAFPAADATVLVPVPSDALALEQSLVLKILLNLQSNVSMAKAHKLYGSLMVDLRPSNGKLIDRATRLVVHSLRSRLGKAVDYRTANRYLFDAIRFAEEVRAQGAAAPSPVKMAILRIAFSFSNDEAAYQLSRSEGNLDAAVAGARRWTLARNLRKPLWTWSGLQARLTRLFRTETRRGRPGTSAARSAPAEKKEEPSAEPDAATLALFAELAQNAGRPGWTPSDLERGTLKALGTDADEVRSLAAPFFGEAPEPWAPSERPGRVETAAEALELVKVNPAFASYSAEDWAEIEKRYAMLPGLVAWARAKWPDAVSVSVNGSFLTDPRRRFEDVDILVVTSGARKPSYEKSRVTDVPGVTQIEAAVADRSTLDSGKYKNFVHYLTVAARWGQTVWGEKLLESFPAVPPLNGVLAAATMAGQADVTWSVDGLSDGKARRLLRMSLTLLAEAGLEPELTPAMIDGEEVEDIFIFMNREVTAARQALARRAVNAALAEAWAKLPEGARKDFIRLRGVEPGKEPGAKSLLTAGATALALGAAAAGLPVLLTGSLWALAGGALALPHLVQAAMIALASHEVLPDRGLIPEWQNVPPLAEHRPRNAARPSFYDRLLRLTDRYRVAEVQAGALSARHEALRRLPHSVQRWVLRHELRHLEFESAHPGWPKTPLASWLEELWVSLGDIADAAPALVRPRERSLDAWARAHPTFVRPDASPEIDLVLHSRWMQRMLKRPWTVADSVALLETGAASFLQGEHRAYALTSGMKGISQLVFAALLEKGPWMGAPREIVVITPIYGCSHNLGEELQALSDVKVRYVSGLHGKSAEEVRALLTPEINENTALVLFETPTNPNLQVLDMKAVSRTVKSLNPEALVAVDNTFATSLGQTPLRDVDMVMVGLTKGETGMGDVIGSVIVVPESLGERFDQVIEARGGRLSAEDEKAASIGIQTAGLRMRRQTETARELVAWLEQARRAGGLVKAVTYPGLASGAESRVAARQMKLRGHMIYWEFDSAETAEHFMKLTRYVRLLENAVSLGQVRTLVELPAGGTHATVSEKDLARGGVTPAGVRLSAGAEPVEDLKRELALIFGILNEHRGRLGEIPYEALDALLMTGPSGESLKRRPPEILTADGRGDADALARAARLPAATEALARRIVQATAWSRYDPQSLLIAHTEVWAHLTGDYRSVTMSQENSTTYRFQDAAGMTAAFGSLKETAAPQEVLRRLPALHRIYTRLGGSNSRTLEILAALWQEGADATLSQQAVAVSYASQEDGLEALILNHALKRGASAGPVVAITPPGSALSKLAELLNGRLNRTAVLTVAPTAPALSAAEAEALARSLPADAGLVIVDEVQLPEVSGRAVAKAVKAASPNAYVALSTTLDLQDPGLFRDGVDFALHGFWEGGAGAGAVMVMKPVDAARGRSHWLDLAYTRKNTSNAVRPADAYRAVMYDLSLADMRRGKAAENAGRLKDSLSRLAGAPGLLREVARVRPSVLRLTFADADAAARFAALAKSAPLLTGGAVPDPLRTRVRLSATDPAAVHVFAGIEEGADALADQAAGLLDLVTLGDPGRRPGGVFRWLRRRWGAAPEDGPAGPLGSARSAPGRGPTWEFGETGRRDPALARWLKMSQLPDELLRDVRRVLEASPEAWDFEAAHRLIEILRDPRVDDRLVDVLGEVADVPGLEAAVLRLDLTVFDVRNDIPVRDPHAGRLGQAFSAELDRLAEAARRSRAGEPADALAAFLAQAPDAAAGPARVSLFHPTGRNVHAHRSYAVLDRSSLRRKMNRLRLNHSLLRGLGAVVSDIDQTLAPHGGRLTPENAYYLGQVLTLGIPVVLVTGKSDLDFIVKGQLPDFLSGLSRRQLKNLRLYTASGSRLFRFDRRGRPVKIWEHPILADAARRDGVKRVVAETFELAMRQFGLSAAKHRKFADGDVLDPGPGKEALLTPLALFVESKLRARPELAEWGVELNVTVGGNGDIGVDPSGKGAALEHVMKTLGLPPEQVFYMGDSFFRFGNDNPVRRRHHNIGYAHVQDPPESTRYLQTLVDTVKWGLPFSAPSAYAFRQGHAVAAALLAPLLALVAAPTLSALAPLAGGSMWPAVLGGTLASLFLAGGSIVHFAAAWVSSAVARLEGERKDDPALVQLVDSWARESARLPVDVIYLEQAEMDEKYGKGALISANPADRKIILSRRWVAASQSAWLNVLRTLTLPLLLRARMRAHTQPFRPAHYFVGLPLEAVRTAKDALALEYTLSMKAVSPSLWARRELYAPVARPEEADTPDPSDNFLGKLEYDLKLWRSGKGPRPVVYIRNTGGAGDVLNNIYLAEQYKKMGAEVALICILQKRAGLWMPSDMKAREPNPKEEDPTWKWDEAAGRYVYDHDAGYGRDIADLEFADPVNEHVFRVTTKTRIRGADIPIGEANLVEFMDRNYRNDAAPENAGVPEGYRGNFFVVSMKDSPEEVAQAEYDLVRRRFAGRPFYAVVTGTGGDYLSNEAEWKVSPVNEEYHMLVLRQMLKRYQDEKASAPPDQRPASPVVWRSIVCQESSPGADLESTPEGMQRVLDELWTRRIMLGASLPWGNAEGVRKTLEAVKLGISSSANMRFFKKLKRYAEPGLLSRLFGALPAPLVRALRAVPLPSYFSLRGRLVVEGLMQRDDTYNMIGKDIKIPGGRITEDSLYFHWSRVREWLVENTALPDPSIAKHLSFKEMAVAIEASQGSTREGIKPTEAEFLVLEKVRALAASDRAGLLRDVVDGRLEETSAEARALLAEFEPLVFDVIRHSIDLKLQIIGASARETDDARTIILLAIQGFLDRPDLPYELTRNAATMLKHHPLDRPTYGLHIFPRPARQADVANAVRFARQVYQGKDPRPLALRLRDAASAADALFETFDVLLNPHDNEYIERNIRFDVFDLAHRTRKMLEDVLPSLSVRKRTLVEEAMANLDRVLALRRADPKALPVSGTPFSEALRRVAQRYEKTELHRHISGSLSPLLLMALYWRSARAREQFIREVLKTDPAGVEDVDAYFALTFGGPLAPKSRRALSAWLDGLGADGIRVTDRGFEEKLASFFGSPAELGKALEKAKKYIEYRPAPKQGTLKAYVEFLATGEIVLRNDPVANRVAFRESVLEEYLRDNVTLMELQVSGVRPATSDGLSGPSRETLESVVRNYMIAFDEVGELSGGHAHPSAIIVARKEPTAVLPPEQVAAADSAAREFIEAEGRRALPAEKLLDQLLAWAWDRVAEDRSLAPEDLAEERAWLDDFREQLQSHQEKRGLSPDELSKLVFRLEATRREQTRRVRETADLKAKWEAESPAWAARLIGVGSVGAEDDFFPWTILTAMRVARRHGLKNSIHVGEAWRPGEEYLAALRVKQVALSGYLDRLEHGTILGVLPRDFTRTLSSDEVLRIRTLQRDILTSLAEEGLPVVSMPTSNVELSVFGDYAHHLLQFFFKQGLRVAVAQDNSWIFHTRGSPGERVKVWLSHPDMKFIEWLAIEQNGFDNAFTPNRLQGLPPIMGPSTAGARWRAFVPKLIPALRKGLSDAGGFSSLAGLTRKLGEAKALFNEPAPEAPAGAAEGSIERGLLEAYEAGQIDRSLSPVALQEDGGPAGRVRPGDVVISFNARRDGLRQLLAAFAREDFKAFARPVVAQAAAAFGYASDEAVLSIQERGPASVTLDAVAAGAGRSQALIAAKGDFARVMGPYAGRGAAGSAQRIEVPGEEPGSVTDAVLKAMGSKDLVVAHYGGAAAAAKAADAAGARRALESIDREVGAVLSRAAEENALVLITSDRGLAESVPSKAGVLEPLGTTNAVPFYFFDPEVQPSRDGLAAFMRKEGRLADVAPTALQALGLPTDGMEGESLLNTGGLTPSRRKVVLLVIEGVGLGDPADPQNAVASAATPYLTSLAENFGVARLAASGAAIGLAPDEPGDDSTGFLNIASGRAPPSPFEWTGADLSDSKRLLEMLRAARRQGKRVHLLGTLSEDHAALEPLQALLELAKSEGLKDVFVHAVLDGRKGPARDGFRRLAALNEALEKAGTGRLATLMGALLGMDVSEDWSKTRKAYEALTGTKGEDGEGGGRGPSGSGNGPAADDGPGGAAKPVDGTVLPQPPHDWSQSRIELAVADVRGWMDVRDGEITFKNVGRQAILEQVERAREFKNKNQGDKLLFAIVWDSGSLRLSPARKRHAMKRLAEELGIPRSMLAEDLTFDVQDFPAGEAGAAIVSRIDRAAGEGSYRSWKVWILTDPIGIPWWQKAAANWPMVAFQILDVGLKVEVSGAALEWLKSMMKERYQYTDEEITRLLGNGTSVTLDAERVGPQDLQKLGEEQRLFNIQA